MRTDVTETTKLMVAFHNFANAPKIVWDFKKHSTEHNLIVTVVTGIADITAALHLRVHGMPLCVLWLSASLLMDAHVVY
jgi:hypothetical protein